MIRYLNVSWLCITGRLVTEQETQRNDFVHVRMNPRERSLYRIILQFTLQSAHSVRTAVVRRDETPLN